MQHFVKVGSHYSLSECTRSMNNDHLIIKHLDIVAPHPNIE